ncbi:MULTISPECIES: CaiB/BaiF CoA transferase family protein [Acinetobacter]|uniref:CoA transferase n=1 Tax=Acinetobacter guillouiae TaxID=106649 RepID=A0A8X8GEW3_ACIGI|nr:MULTISPECIES: CaiB/BaiF CoA-transferase family protein [Acinetobacter]MCF0266159.1 CoA transferase [Acinetobacter guillouiae]MCS4296625.1 crotonobetainyl-CoA:carnitine CoA-transferase CaiB-like acyl-CoA transferase [Acinetobacter guillouiae]MCW2250746.1 crotonobetainyl-CoA:carnitine CoA-transferase CaiB-like acyl-CoA transferase [Acinetobacter sp. BIGb0204]NII37156.1 crotonobetainyl-CoA:carnitine CoA-transferase CaiB-like acyl-CoA transferase [Acinetobacter sp. BIGb0196]
MGALQGIRVLDLSRVLAGPWCGQVLADLGAEVIKIERPKVGDDTRMWGPPWMLDQQGKATRESGYYQSANRNKSSVAIDMATQDGQRLLQHMVKTADIVIENFKAGSLKKYGLDYETLKHINPKLIYCSITGFGQDGPRAEEPGYDFIIQGMSGLMSITGEKEGELGASSQKVGVAVVDIQTGLYATIAIQAALISRQQTGVGQYIDMSLLDVQVAGLANQGMNYLSSGIAPQRMGNHHPNIVPYQTFKAQDKEFILACGNDKQFKDLCIAIGKPELLDQSNYLRNQDRVKYRQELVALLSEYFLSNTAKHWVDAIHAVKVPVGVINSVADALDEPQIQYRKMVVNIPHTDNPDFNVIGSPIKMTGTPVEYRNAPPRLGEHTKAILEEFCSDDELLQLKQQGVIEGIGL